MTDAGPLADGRRHDVLVANSRVDEAWASWVADLVRDSDRSVALLQDGLRDFLDVRQLIERELRAAGQVVVLLSKSGSPFLGDVVSVANGLGERVVPVHVDGGAVTYPRELAHLPAVDLTNVSLEEAGQRLLSALDGSAAHRILANFVRRPPPRPSSFVGRDRELGWLSSAFLGGQPAVVISGRNGVGKSALAAHFIRMNRTRWADVLWSGPARFAEDQLKILTRPRGPSLLVIDGAGDYRSVRDALWPVLLDRDLVHVLVTSADPAWPAPFRVLDVGPLDRESAARLVRESVPGGDESEAGELTRTVGDSPAAIASVSRLAGRFPSVADLVAELAWFTRLAESVGGEEHGFYYLDSDDPTAVGAFERAFVGLRGDIELLAAGKHPWRRWWRGRCAAAGRAAAGADAAVRVLAAAQPIPRIVVNVGSTVFVKATGRFGPRLVSLKLTATELRRFEQSQRLRQDPVTELLGEQAG